MKRRIGFLLLGAVLLIGAAASGWLVASPYDTEFAGIPVACDRRAVEAWPESRPDGLSGDEITYAEITGDPRPSMAYTAELTRFFEARACGDVARSQLLRIVPAGLVAFSLGMAAERTALRRRKDPMPPEGRVVRRG